MLYLIPDWHETTKLEEDRIYTLSKFFSKAGQENKILLTNPIPFLRYQLNENGYSYNSVIRVFDSLQHIQTSVGQPLTLEDIPIAPEVDKIYTPNGTLLLKGDRVVGRVFYNDYGFVSKVRYPKDNGVFIEDIYDDRGFISAKHYGNDKNDTNKIYTTEYFNELGEHTLTQMSGRIFVEKANHAYLEKREYQSIDEAVKEVLDFLMYGEMASLPNSRVSIITTTEEDIISQTKGIPHNGKMIRIVTDRSVRDAGEATLVIDSKSQVEQVLGATTYIPIFLPELNLGTSDSVSVMKIYLKISGIGTKEEKIIESILEDVIKDEQLSLVCELDDFKVIDRAKFLQKMMIEAYFEVDTDSEDYQKAEKYIIAKKEKRLFTPDAEAVKEMQQSAEWLNYVGAVNAKLRLSYITQPDSILLEETFREARVYLDFEAHYNMFRHAKAVSHGIPILSPHMSDFVVDGENGFILGRGKKDMMTGLDYFINHLKNWNQALVCSIDIIEQHEPGMIMSKWQEIIPYEN